MIIKDTLKRTLSLWSNTLAKIFLMVKRDNETEQKTSMMRDFLLISGVKFI